MYEVKFYSIFQDEFISLISIKRAVGFKYETEAMAFGRIDRFFCDNGLSEKRISKELCDLWCRKRSYESDSNHCSRVSSFRVFCKYLQDLGYPVYVPPKGLTKHPPKYDAHIFTDDELERLALRHLLLKLRRLLIFEQYSTEFSVFCCPCRNLRRLLILNLRPILFPASAFFALSPAILDFSSVFNCFYRCQFSLNCSSATFQNLRLFLLLKHRLFLLILRHFLFSASAFVIHDFVLFFFTHLPPFSKLHKITHCGCHSTVSVV